MEQARWERVKAVFQEAFEREPAGQAAIMAAGCGSDAELREAVERLLRAHARAAGPLDSPPPVDLDPADPSEGEDGHAEPPHAAPARIGAYRIVRELGRGGMGTVYLAERDEPGLRKTVAVKVVQHGMDSGFVVSRFHTERQILAALEHSGIARLYDGGTTEEGLPYFVMEYVDGEDLLTYCDGRRLPITARLQLFLRVCQAVQYAHQGLVVHRDLKPSNILVTGSGEAKLLDFGIAKLLSPALGEGGGEETASVIRLMTPDYASPEQVRGERVTTASDVYSLGVILYELLCGHRPYRVKGGGPAEIERAMLAQDVDPPSAALARTEKATARDGGGTVRITRSEVSARRQATPGTLRRRLRGDLDNVVLKALRKEPAERYATAAELGEDIRRHLEGRPVEARRGTPAYRASRFLRRHQALVTTAAAAILSLTVGLGIAAFAGKGRPAATSAHPARVMLAVLPFENLSGDPGQEYLSDGMTEEMITQLGRLQPERLGVIARTSAMAYKGTRKTAADVAHELGVDYILEGSIRRAGDRVRVSGQLIRARDQTNLWAESYERDLRDILSTQTEVAQAVAEEIQLQLTPVQWARLMKARRPLDPQAHEDYLKGRYFWNTRTREGLERAVERFQATVDRDPGHALAWGGLADCYVLYSDYSVAPSREAFPKAIDAATKALALDDSLAEPHIALAYAKYRYEWDWPGAEREFARGIELNASYATGPQWYSEYLAMMGRWEEALAQIHRAQELDPLAPIINADEGWYLYMARRSEEAIVHLKKTLEMRPDFAPTHFYLGEAYELDGRYDDAIAEFRRARELGAVHGLLGLAHALALSGRTREAREAMAELEKATRPAPIPGLHAIFYAALGERGRAFEELESAYRERADVIVYLKVHPFFDPLRSDARFGELLHRVGFPP